ncbi:MAG: ThuA domain-containing protein, partial [Candidatus Omnitrophica bacterium]|nr:ThuA domain-containing protein [Candidatus Omnitrophota bacterium]
KGKSSHDAYGPLKVNLTQVKHPIIEGMTIRSFETVDELYYDQDGDLPIEPLATARSKNTGKEEPMAWAYDYGKGRVFQTLLGHSAQSLRPAGVAELIRRGALWASGH